MKCAHHQSGQRGFTLVELMIAIVISLILLAGVLNIMLSNQSSLRTQNALAGLQARARLLNLVLDNAFAQAGYKVDPTANNQYIFPSQSGKPVMHKGAFIAASSSANQARIRVRFRAAGGLYNCFGEEIGGVPSKSTTINSDALIKKMADFALEYNGNENRLSCLVYDPDDDAAYDPANERDGTHPLINNVRAFRTRFALDTDSDGSVDQYVSTLSQSQQTEVLAVRIQALLQTKKRKLSTSMDRTFTFMDGSTIQVTNSRRGFLLFDRTVALKNAIP